MAENTLSLSRVPLVFPFQVVPSLSISSAAIFQFRVLRAVRAGGRMGTHLMEIQVSQIEKVRFAVSARSHTVICDQPADNGGSDTGMTPPELLLASLGTCAAFYAAEYLRTRKLADTGVEVSVSAEKLKPPARLGNFKIGVTSPVPLSPEQREGLIRSVHHCLVHNTLLNPPQIAIELFATETGSAKG